MDPTTSLILPASLLPQQAQSLAVDWLKANPVAPQDIASAAFDLVEAILVPVRFVDIMGSASFEGVVKYWRNTTQYMHDEGYRDDPNEFSINERDDEGDVVRTFLGKRVQGHVQCYLQGCAITLLSDLAPAPPYDLSRCRAAQADELGLPRLAPNLSDAEWDERIGSEVMRDVRAQAERFIRSQAPKDASRIEVDEVSIRDVQSAAHKPIEAWTIFYHLRYRYQSHRVDALMDGQSGDLYGQRITSTMRAWKADEKTRVRSLRNAVLLEMFLVPVTALLFFFVFINNQAEVDHLGRGLAVLIIAMTHLGMLTYILRLLRPTPKPEKDQAVREGQDIGKLLQTQLM